MNLIRNSRGEFDLDGFLAQPLFAHLATASPEGPRESPVWFLWEEDSLWIIASHTYDSFPKRIAQDSRVAVGVIQYEPRTGLVRHVGFRGKATLEFFDREKVMRLFEKYLGPRRDKWDSRLTQDVIRGEKYLLVRVIPKTVVVRDQSYSHPD